MASVQPIRLAYNTVYVVDDGADRVLVDTGPDYRGAGETLLESLGGRMPGLVVATHGHLDHAGLGRWWQEEHGVAVAIGAADGRLADAPQLADRAEFDGFVAWVRSAGAPPEVEREVIHGLELRREWAKAAASAADYPAMGRDHRWPSGLRYQHFQPARLIFQDAPVGVGLRALVSPGHTPGNLVLIHEGEGWLFSGDQLLPEITPTPAIQAAAPAGLGDWRFRSLPAFVASLSRLRERRFERCFPGHGEPFGRVGDVVGANLAQIEQRTEKVAEALRSLGRASVYGLSETIYPRAVRRRFWQIAATIQGHVDLLEEQGRVRTVEGGYELVDA
jgi:glyoxylase-like metal-dependent hydrolase (beta-lactamase superfamily II)